MVVIVTFMNNALSTSVSQVPARSNAFTSASSRKAPVPSARVKKPESRPLHRAPAPSRANQAAKPPSPPTLRRANNQTFKKTPNLNQTQTVKGTWVYFHKNFK